MFTENSDDFIKLYSQWFRNFPELSGCCEDKNQKAPV